jgi:poly(A) polymerase
MARIVIDGLKVEFIIPREEIYSPHSRKPTVIPSTLEQDVYRRDFTMNALYMDLETYEIVDPSGKGIEDIKKGVIRATHPDPNKVFEEDPLRMLRAIRQSAKFGFEIDPQTLEAIKKNVDRIDIVSKERISDELKKIITGPNVGKAFELLYKTGLLHKILPEVAQLYGVSHDTPHHEEDIWEHVINAIERTKGDVVDRLVALFHDIGKPATKQIIDGVARYFGHAEVGAKMAREILTRLRFPNNIISEVVKRIELHMKPFEYTPQWSDERVRRFIKDMGDLLDKILEFAEADILAARSKTQEEKLKNLEELKRRVKEQKEKYPHIFGKGKFMSGDEIAELFGRKPGPWMKEVLEFIENQWVKKPDITKDEMIRRLYSRFKDLFVKPLPQKEEKLSAREIMEIFSLEPGPLVGKILKFINNKLEQNPSLTRDELIKLIKEEFNL